jgi:hypothetical protein
MFEGCPGGQPSFDYAVVDDCPDVKKGSHKQRNQLNRLKARVSSAVDLAKSDL